MNKLALISVSNKDGITDFAKALVEKGYKITATGNTAKVIIEAGIEVEEVGNLTKFPEIFDGRVKTLHPKIFGGILFRRENEKDIEEARINEIHPIDIVCVNFYPFVRTAEDANSSLDIIIENIDIGGPSLIRAAAKNYKYVSAWEYKGEPSDAVLHKEELEFNDIELKTRSYK